MMAIILLSTCLNADFLEQGKTLGKGSLSEAKEMIEKTSIEDKSGFDAKKAFEQVKSGDRPKSEVVKWLSSEEVQKNQRENKHLHEEEAFLKGEILEEDQDFTIQTCRQSGEALLMSSLRELKVVVENQNKAVCQGHSKFKQILRGLSFEKATEPLRKKLEQDPTIESFEIECAEILDLFYVAKIKWRHVDNCSSCNRLKEQSSTVIEEQWVYQDKEAWELSQSPECTVLEHTCLDNIPREITGVLIKDKCWKEQLSFFYHFPKTKKCAFLNKNSCELLSQKCLRTSPFGCALWEMTFKCYRKKASQKIEDFELEEYAWETESVPNTSFAEVSAKLAIFAEAKQELENSQIKDASKLEIFKGKKMKCSKSIANNLIYDCCFKHAGLAKQAGLAKCSADEMSLAERREAGLCHYVGSYEKKKLGIKTSDEHVYCCFPSKLSRIVQEEGRKQLKKEWGTPKEPKCYGFNFETLSHLNFSEMDLSEMAEDFQQQLPEDFEDKMQAFQHKLKNEIQKEKA